MLIIYYILFYYLLFIIYNLLYITCYLLFTICYLSFIIHHFITYYILLIIFYLLYFTYLLYLLQNTQQNLHITSYSLWLFFCSLVACPIFAFTYICFLCFPKWTHFYLKHLLFIRFVPTYCITSVVTLLLCFTYAGFRLLCYFNNTSSFALYVYQVWVTLLF